jgi:hypothetical protein
MGLSNSANVGGMQRKRSIKGLLPGDESVTKVLDRKRAEKGFRKLVNKFMNIE